ncbi:MAG TPA: anaerobic ribonucleoside-triphosphate reductase activating protein [Candidatus Borkfalkia excrementipullorum]|nr:anaerobic ribonucleoside-triphosphate reductase activating protein [Candidatus Borkfalkia excrementipullorum]
MFYANIKKYDVANGVGVRVSLFVSGCTHRCKGCFNAEAWDFSYGKPYTEETEEEILDALDKDYIAGLSLLGGEPFEPQNQRALLPLLRKFRERYPQKDVWCYSGYTFDSDLQEGGRAHCEATDEMLSMLDILVDGEFVEDLKDLKLRFRGSANQRIIDVPRTLREGEVRLWKDGQY